MSLYKVLVFVLLAGGCALLPAQGTDLGTIRGHIADAQGAAVPGAKIKLADLATGNTMEVTSDGEGNYQAVNLRPGEYRLTITFQGFSTVEVSGAIARGGEATRVDAGLNAARVAESVTLTAEAPAIQSETPAVTATLASRELLELPRDSRDFFTFL